VEAGCGLVMVLCNNLARLLGSGPVVISLAATSVTLEFLGVVLVKCGLKYPESFNLESNLGVTGVLGISILGVTFTFSLFTCTLGDSVTVCFCKMVVI